MTRQRVKQTHAKTLGLRNGSASDLRLVAPTPARSVGLERKAEEAEDSTMSEILRFEQTRMVTG